MTERPQPPRQTLRRAALHALRGAPAALRSTRSPLPALGAASLAALGFGCSVIVQYGAGQTTEQARAAAETTASVRLCDAVAAPNVSFEAPVLPPQMTFNSYQSISGWRSVQGEPLVGRGNRDLPLVPDSAAYGEQHGILKPRQADGAPVQDNSAYEYDLQVTPGQRYALVFSTAAGTLGTDVELTLTGADMAPFTFATRTSWHQRVVPFTPNAETVTMRFTAGARRDVGAFQLGRGELDIFVDVAGVFAVCAD
jgi:hypothetical protein